MAQAPKEFDCWIASGTNRTADQLAEVAPAYREAGGTRAIVSRLMLTADTQLADLEALLARYAEMGFADADIMLLPVPTPAKVRR